MIKKITLLFIYLILIISSNAYSQEVKKIGKYKDWETIVFVEGENKVCFAQSIPILQAPKKKPKRCKTVCQF